MSRKIAVVVAAGSLFGGASAGPASGAQTFGADMTQPVGTGCVQACTVHTWVRSNNTAETGSPVAGVLTKVRLKYAGDGGSGRLIVLRQEGNPVQFRNVGPELPFTVPATTAQVFSFDVRRRVAVGDRLGLIASVTLAGLTPMSQSTDRYFANGPPRRSFYMNGAHATDTVAAYSDLADVQPLIDGTVEPDADADGFGDESQDRCVGTAGTDGGCEPPPPTTSDPGTTQEPAPVVVPPDLTAPDVLALSATNRRFAVGRAATSIAAARRGTKFRYALTEGGTATYTFERALAGRRSGGQCVKPTRRLRRSRRCTRYQQVGVISRNAVQGENELAFSGRIGRKSLRLGRHRLVLTAVDAAGNRSEPKLLTFTVVRR